MKTTKNNLIEFEIMVISKIEELAEMTTSDAQGFIENHYSEYIALKFKEGKTAEYVAKEILRMAFNAMQPELVYPFQPLKISKSEESGNILIMETLGETPQVIAEIDPIPEAQAYANLFKEAPETLKILFDLIGYLGYEWINDPMIKNAIEHAKKIQSIIHRKAE